MVTFNSGEGRSAQGWGAKQCEDQHMSRMTLQPHLCPDVARVLSVREDHTPLFFFDDLVPAVPFVFLRTLLL